MNLQRSRRQLFCLLFLGSFVLAVGFPWLLGTGTSPGLAHSPTVAIAKGTGLLNTQRTEKILPKVVTAPPSPLSHSPTLTQNSPDPTASVEQGKALYDAGNFSEAVSVLKTAAEAFKARGDKLPEAMALSNLALAYQQLGSWSEAEQALTESLNLLQSRDADRNASKEDRTERLRLLAQTLEIQGRLQLSLGKPDQALKTWQQSAATYAQIGNKDGVTQSLVNQAQALQNLGMSRSACKTLLNALEIDNPECQISDEQLKTLEGKPDSLTQAIALRHFGDALQLVGDLQKSQAVLELSLKIAEDLKSAPNINAARFSLGNTIRAQRTINTNPQTRQATEEATKQALSFYQQVAQDPSASPTLKIQSQLNQLSLLIEAKKFPEARELVAQIKPELDRLPPSRTATYTRINLAQSLMKLSPPEYNTASELLAKAVAQAKSLGDQRTLSYALGNLGELYEKTGQFKEATDLTNQALVLAQTLNAPDIAYRWQWQLGRLLRAQGNQKEAIAAYNVAIDTLNSIRQELVSINPNVQFSFRESVEPVYRQLVGLLLQSAENEQTSEQERNDALEGARNAIEGLQLAELDNFFRDACRVGEEKNIGEIDQSAAVIYPIVLRDRLAVVLSLPNKTFKLYQTRLPQNEVEQVFEQLRYAIAPFGQANRMPETQSPETNPNLKQETEKIKTDPQPEAESTPTDPNQRGIGVEQRECQNRGIGAEPRCYDLPPPQQYLPLAQQVYQWLIKPAEQDIAASGVKTLVFVLDSPLLNLPMAVLHDGEKFLVEKYAIAYTPGLKLLGSQALGQRGKLSALKAGLTEARQLKVNSSPTPIDFPALFYVKEELEKIQSTVSGELLLDKEFTTAAIKQEIDSVPFPIVHLATHGLFSSNQEDTFILTWDDRLNINELSQVLQTREEVKRGAIELLVLSACQTATGDKRAALGLAGVAVKSGARSTLATLWFVRDDATAELMTKFYQKLAESNISNKAEALRLAQVELLKDERYKQPIFWAPYVLVGNWL